MKVTILNTQSGDWEGLFIEDDLITEGHEISRDEFLELDKKHHFWGNEIVHKTINDIDEETLSRRGAFFPKLSDLNGEY
jgi:hypothetical protein